MHASTQDFSRSGMAIETEMTRAENNVVVDDMPTSSDDQDANKQPG